MAQPILKVKDVSKTIKNKQILSPLSFELEKGKCLCLCGGNGAGKSTLIRLIIGELKPSSGFIQMNGKDNSKMKPVDFFFMGYMPDHLIFPRSMTAMEILRFYGKLKGVDDAKITEIMEMVGLTSVSEQKVGGFSKGMNQRLLFAQALLHNPSLLIMDEPTIGLDPGWVKTFESLINKLKEKGTSILFSTHDLHVVEKVSDQVILLEEGNMLLNQPLQQITDEYQTVENAFFTLS